MPHESIYATSSQTVLHQIHYQLFGLSIYCVVLIVIVTFFAPIAKRYRRLGRVEQANKITNQMLIFISLTAAVGIPLIVMLR